MIYLDNNSTTRIDDRVLEAMIPYYTALYGNAASNHRFGVEINQAVKSSRAQVASLIGCDVNEVIFTSGATEAINLAIKGVAKNYSHKGKHIITLQTEHPAVIDTCNSLEKDGFEIIYLSVNRDGILSLDELTAALRLDTILVSVMTANNETGVIQPIKEIAAIAHEFGALMLTDATQAIGKTLVRIDELNTDLLALSAHKFHGPKGIGALYCRSRRPNKVKLLPIIHGGGHERGVRSGTLNVPGIVGLGMACELVEKELFINEIKMSELRNYLESELLKLDEAFVNGTRASRLCNTSNICFHNADADAIISGLKDLMVSNGSACSSTKVEPSHVLKAMGLTDQDAYSSLRLSLSKFSTKAEIVEAISLISDQIIRLRSMSLNPFI